MTVSFDWWTIYLWNNLLKINKFIFCKLKFSIYNKGKKKKKKKKKKKNKKKKN